jgi:hypothetical protein
MKKTIITSSLIITIAIVACEKKLSLPDRFTPNPSGNTNIKFLNMSPGAASVNFFANSTKISGTSPGGTSGTVVTGMAYPALFPSTIGYATIPSGSLKIDVKVPDSAAVNPGANVLTTTQSFDAGKFYTFVLLDTVTQAKALVAVDDPAVADQTKAYLRVANFTADSAITIKVLKTSLDYAYSKTYTSVPEKTILPFDSLGAGTGQVYSITFMRASNNAVLGTISNFAPSRTKKYTFYMRGFVKTTSSTGFGSYTNF